MGIIYQHDKRSNITYAYESKAYWDKEKKMSRAKRTLIGRVDPKTGEIVPTDGRCQKLKKKTQGVAADGPDYKLLYEKLLKKYTSQQKLIDSLRRENKKLRGKK